MVECMKESNFYDIWVRNVGKDAERHSLAAQSIVRSLLCSLADKTKEMRKIIPVAAKR